MDKVSLPPRQESKMLIELGSRLFSQPPTITRFPPTGSYNFRLGLFNHRPMTLQEQQFEKFVNDMQAKHDEVSQVEEWRRRKDLEEAAILFYHELNEDLEQFGQRMRTPDQREMDFHCQRRNRKAEYLEFHRQLYLARGSLALEAILEAEAKAKSKAEAIRAEFKAKVEASSRSG